MIPRYNGRVDWSGIIFFLVMILLALPMSVITIIAVWAMLFDLVL